MYSQSIKGSYEVKIQKICMKTGSARTVAKRSREATKKHMGKRATFFFVKT